MKGERQQAASDGRVRAAHQRSRGPVSGRGFLFSLGAIIQEDFAVCSNRGEELSVRAELEVVDERGVRLDGLQATSRVFDQK